MSTESFNAYPRNVVWFIEAVDTAGSVAQSGSAVAICVKEKGGTESRKFLLTCGHVIRGKSKDTPPDDGCGPALSKIQCYPNFSGHASPMLAVPHELWAAVTAKDVPNDDRRAPKDWILLKVENPSFQDYNCARDCGELPVNSPCRIVGYPGGKSGFQNGIVANVIIDEQSQQNPPPVGCLTFVGNQSRPGMSGGGIFDVAGNLVGLHRSRTDGALQLGGVALDHIRVELERLFNLMIIPVSRDAAEGAIKTASEVREGVSSLAEEAKNNPHILDPLRGIAPTITRLEKDLDAMQAAKEAHEIVVHKLGFMLEAVKTGIHKAVTEPSIQNRTAGLRQIGAVRNAAQQLVGVMERCTRLYESGVDDANEFLKDVNDVNEAFKNNEPAPFRPLETFGNTCIDNMGWQLQRSMTETAKHLPFAELQATISGLHLQVPQGSPLEGLSKIGLLQDLVRRLVAEHDAWQKLHRDIPLL